MKTFEETLFSHYKPNLACVERLCDQNDLFLRDQQHVQYDQRTHTLRLHEFAFYGYTDH